MKAGIALIQMDSSGNGFDIGRMALPANTSGIPVFPTMLLGVSSEVGVVAANGTVAWYPPAIA
jgi:hypothetical protein